MNILIASQNGGKQLEVRSFLEDVAKIVVPQDFPELRDFDVDETGSSYEENALLKARGFAVKSGLPSLSDDTGIEIMALDGQPGIHSKRFFSGSDVDRNNKILDSLKDAPDRSAKFMCAMALVDPVSGSEQVFKAVVDGKIALQMEHGEGFAYDMIFIPDGYDKTYSQLGLEIKNKIGHRGRALALVKKYLQEVAEIQ
mgnify:CR=1 FL=1